MKRRIVWQAVASLVIVCVLSTSTVLSAQPPTSDSIGSDPIEIANEFESIEVEREYEERLDDSEVLSEESREPPPDIVPTALPGGAEAKSAATPQAISLPSAEGSIEGMGESFSPVLSAGTGTFSVPIALPAGRAGVQPSLALSYSTAGGDGPVGLGWAIGAPFIARQTDRGLPRYIDAAGYHGQEDRFIYNGGQELVPVNSAAMSAVDRMNPSGAAFFSGTPYPSGVDVTWQEYRARVEGGFMRFFRAPDSRRWIVLSKDGTRFDFGALSAGEGPSGIETVSALALHTELDSGAGPVYAWQLTRMSDAHGSTVYYTYTADRGQRYLSEVYYLSPASCGPGSPSAQRNCPQPLANYGVRVRLDYGSRPDPITTYVPGFRCETALRLTRITITSAEDTVGTRNLVRRYHLAYAPDATNFHSLLNEIVVEGRPDALHSPTQVYVASDVAETALTSAIVGRTLPPMRFAYTPAPVGPIAGFGGVASTITPVVDSPTFSADNTRADLFDVNSDGLADFIVTEPGRFRTEDDEPAVGVFFNGFSGTDATPATAGRFSAPIAVGIEAGMSGTLDLSNSNIQPMDIDGDGRSDLLHMPRRTTYGFFSPTRTFDPPPAAVSPAEQGWQFSYAAVELPPTVDPRIDFGADSPFLRAFDVNNDHLIDIVRTTGTSLQTWLNLGWLPGGSGKFGNASYDAMTSSWTLSTEPIETCLPHAGLPLDFASSEIRLADMNGDGIQDIVKVRRGQVLYWPGRGDGVFGTGSRACPSGYASGREIRMADPPRDLPFTIGDVHLADVNGDGASDLVQVRFDAIDVWFNRNGTSFTSRLITPVSARAPGFRDNVRFADLDGSGTLDVVYAHATRWEYVDLMGGARPHLLAQVENGLGAITSLEYGTSAEDYLDDLAAATTCTADGCDRFTWSVIDAEFGCDPRFSGGTDDESCYLPGTSPVISSVVRATETTDQFDALGREENVVRTEYRYHDAYYDGIEQEFRGFGAADAIAIGDAVHPTATTRTHFYQGRRPSFIANDRTFDNPYEPMKGRAFLTESFDATGRYLSSVHSSYTLRYLIEGLDGRYVLHAFVHQTDELRYDTTSFLPANVEFAISSSFRQEDAAHVAFDTRFTNVWRRGTTYAHLRSTVDVVDNVGNVHRQTAWGRIRGENGEIPAEKIVSNAVPALITPSTWLWRTAQTNVTGDGTSVALGDTVHSYTNQGDLLLSTITVGIPSAHDFSGDAGTGAAEGLVQSAATLDSSTEYDSWGNAIESCGGSDLAAGPDTCLRYTTITYDTPYRSLPLSEAIAVELASSTNPPGYTIVNGFRTLSTQATWSRGYGLLLSVTDPNAQTTTVVYDGVGRLTAIYAPDNSALPTNRFTYELVPGGAPVSVVHAYQGTSSGSITLAVKTRAYVDGLGRTRASLADDTTNWEQSGVVEFTARGTPRRAWQPAFLAGTTPSLSSAVAIPSGSTHTGDLGCPATTLYDAWGRAVAVTECAGDALAASTATSYRPLSMEVYDPLDLAGSGPFVNTPAITRMDGHGRVIEQVLQNKRFNGTTWGATEYYRLKSTYRPDGAVTEIQRAQVDSALFGAGYVSSRHIERTFSYDTSGRRVAATDPDTDNASAAPGARTWRYLFNEVGDLAAVRDPRGCGQNFYYDRAGRLIAEDYVRCDEAQLQGELPDDDIPAGAIGLQALTGARMVDVRHYFDVDPPWASDVTGTSPAPTPARPSTTHLLGRMTGTSDRGARTLLSYDRRGRTSWTGRQVAMIASDGYSTATLADPPVVDTMDGIDDDESRIYDTTVTYVTVPEYDHADRPEYLTYPRDPDYGSGTAPVIKGRMYYDGRSLPRRVDLIVDATTYPLLTPISYSRDRLVTNIQYDHQKPGMADSSLVFTYDARRRVLRESLARTGDSSAPVGDLNRVGGFVFFRQHIWDAANNLRELRDDVSPTEFPAGYRPSRTRLEYDGLYRVARAQVDYRQTAGGAWTTDTALDWRDAHNYHRPADPMREEPAPMMPVMPSNRVAQLNYDYDWLANMTSFTDNASSFYERSIGTITNGDTVAGRRPSAMYISSHLPIGAPSYSPGTDRGGYVELDYGVSGNAVAMTVHARCFDRSSTSTCHDGGNSDLATRRTDLRAACLCVAEQHYQYRYDEVNRISEARRFDRGGTGVWTLAVRQRYRYDAGNQRIIKQTLDDDFDARNHLYIYPGDFDRSGMIRNGAGTEYLADMTLGSETQYLVAGARVVWKNAAPSPTALSNSVRVLHSIGDIIGTTAAVIDAYSGELVEMRSYYPNGAQETLRTQDVQIQPELSGFTTKETDDEVGITYFGQRYLFQHLGRWTTPDPLHVHAVGGGEALNSYHYVSGNLLQARDPLGLCGGPGEEACEAGAPAPVLIPETPSPPGGSGTFRIVAPVAGGGTLGALAAQAGLMLGGGVVIWGAWNIALPGRTQHRQPPTSGMPYESPYRRPSVDQPGQWDYYDEGGRFLYSGPEDDGVPVGPRASSASGGGGGSNLQEAMANGPAAGLVRHPDGTVRDRLGHFASEWNAGQPASGTAMAREFAAFLAENGMDIVGNEIVVKTPWGTRVYDFVVRVNGRLHGVEVKMNSAEPTREQRFIDSWVNNGGRPTGTGRIRGETVVSATTVHLESSGGPVPIEAESGQ
jgi:RHS repeat-associated protein